MGQTEVLLSMSRTRLIVLSLLAVFAVGAVGSASASAAACKTKKTKWVYCSGGQETTTAMNVEGTSGTSVLRSKIGTEVIEAICGRGIFKGTVESEGKSTGSGTSSSQCHVIKPATCTIGEPITGNATDALTKLVSEPEDEFTGAGAGEEFTKVELKVCALKGKYTVTGGQTCKLDATHETEQKIHELICTSAGSKLKFGTEPLTISGTAKVQLVNGAAWSVQEN